MKVFGFFYTSNTWESSSLLQTLHASKEGAEKEMNKHKEKLRERWQRLVDADEDKGTEDGFENVCPFGQHESWFVEELEVLGDDYVGPKMKVFVIAQRDDLEGHFNGVKQIQLMDLTPVNPLDIESDDPGYVKKYMDAFLECEGIFIIRPKEKVGSYTVDYKNLIDTAQNMDKTFFYEHQYLSEGMVTAADVLKDHMKDQKPLSASQFKNRP